MIKAGITPILCVGETEADYDAGNSEKVIREELAGSLADLCPKCVGEMVIAYEPIWAIGTGKSASVEIAENCCKIVRDQVKVMYGEEAAEKYVSNMVEVLSLITSLNIWLNQISMVH